MQGLEKSVDLLIESIRKWPEDQFSKEIKKDKKAEVRSLTGKWMQYNRENPESAISEEYLSNLLKKHDFRQKFKIKEIWATVLSHCK